MKKILLVLLLTVSFIGNMKAENLYSAYGDYSEYSDNYIQSSDVRDVQVERRYKIYSQTANDGDYFIENENPLELPFIDKDNYIETPYSEFSKEKPEDKLNRVVLEQDYYEYQKMKKAHYIHLYSIIGSGRGLKIREVKVYTHDKEISFKYKCEECEGTNGVVNDDDLSSGLLLYNNSGVLTIDLLDDYDIETLTFKLYLYDEGLGFTNYAIKYTGEEDFTSLLMVMGNFRNSFKSDTLTDVHEFTTNIDDYDVIFPQWSEPVVTTDEVLENKTTKVNKYKMYKYKDIKYHYFNYDRNYLDGYYTSGNENYPFVDDSLYKDFYRFKIRDKVVIKDDLEITSYDTKLSDFILESTVNDIPIYSNINYYQNGTYDVIFRLPFQEVTKKVKVNILENDYNAVVKELETVLKQNEQLEKEVNELLNTQKDNDKSLKKIEDLNKKIEKLNKQLEDNKMLIDSLKKQVKEYKDNNKELLKDNKNLEAQNSKLNKVLMENELKIKQLDELVFSLREQNKEDNDYNSLVTNFNAVNEKNNQTIDNLISHINMLNNQISNENHNIDLLVKNNNDNLIKYQENLDKKQALLNDEKEKNKHNTNELKKSLENNEKLSLLKTKHEKRLNQDKYIIIFLILLIIILNIYFIKRNKKF